ncbi:MAG TPA: hypothetical protein VLE96_03910 [Chlamydiales bacterium]|nr:hypothetical protein [Chlamydiales bacterium]
MRHTVALFGEAEKGQWESAHIVKALPELVDLLGNPPVESLGLFFAIQALLYKREVIYFRVQEEGFSKADYMAGLKILKNKSQIKHLHALCMPGVGDPELIQAFLPVCEIHKTHLIVNQKDLFDYLTCY